MFKSLSPAKNIKQVLVLCLMSMIPINNAVLLLFIFETSIILTPLFYLSLNYTILYIEKDINKVTNMFFYL